MTTNGKVVKKYGDFQLILNYEIGDVPDWWDGPDPEITITATVSNSKEEKYYTTWEDLRVGLIPFSAEMRNLINEIGISDFVLFLQRFTHWSRAISDHELFTMLENRLTVPLSSLFLRWENDLLIWHGYGCIVFGEMGEHVIRRYQWQINSGIFKQEICDILLPPDPSELLFPESES